MTISSDISSLLQQPSNTPYSVKGRVDNGSIQSVPDQKTMNSLTDSMGAPDMEKDDFLLLLVTQLRYQDPLNPMENTQFVSQLAQFRALEGTNNIEKAIGKLDDSFKTSVDAQTYAAQSVSNTAAVSLIGKNVRIEHTSITIRTNKDIPVPIGLNLGKAMDATIEIRNSEGETVKTLHAKGNGHSKEVNVVWNGDKDDGTRAQPGTYSIHIADKDKKRGAYAFVENVVTGVRFSPEGAMVKINGKEWSIGNILDVSSESQTPQMQQLSPQSALSLLDKQVRIKQTTVHFGGNPRESVPIKINAGNRAHVTLHICDGTGAAVFAKTVPAENGVASVNWNGETVNGDYAQPGTYSLSIDGQENDPTLYPFEDGTIDGVSNRNGSMILRMNGRTIEFSDIVDISSS